MDGHSAFGWTLIKELDLRDLRTNNDNLKTTLNLVKAEAGTLKERADTYGAECREFAGQLESLQVAQGKLKDELVRSQAEVKQLTESLAVTTSKQKQANDELLEARKLLWGVPDMLSKEAAEQVDWQRMGLPDPMEAKR